jgi:alkanesulfonate monooxygenase SsuD/methylene tetrahydromethanopterin reductase-like flavin-dependent oxidoreductase (luciferase family)
VLKQYCEAVGCDYQGIHRMVGTICFMEDTDELAQAKVPEAVRKLFGSAALIGSPATLRKQIAAFEDAGVQELVLRFPEVLSLNGMRRFAREVMG